MAELDQLRETSAVSLEWPRLREQIARQTGSSAGRDHVLALEPRTDAAWIARQQDSVAEVRTYLATGAVFYFSQVFAPESMLEKARIPGASLEPEELLRLLALTETMEEWRSVAQMEGQWDAVAALSLPVTEAYLAPLLHALRGKILPDGTLSDDASPELARLRHAIGRQHRAIEESLRRSLRAVSESGAAQEELITVRGDRFVIPVKTEQRRKVPGVIHGSSSSGQTVFVEPMETVESNNELLRLLDEEQAEVHRILVAMTRAVGENAGVLQAGAEVLIALDVLFACARFAQMLDCVRPEFTAGEIAVKNARHPLLDLRMKAEGASVVPLTMAIENGARQLIISGPNTGGKTVSLKTVGLLALMAQAGLPVPAEEAKLPLFDAVYADIGDAQSIERNLSTFSAHMTNLDRITREADAQSLVLLDELGSATDPEEGAALAVAISGHFLRMRAWSLITTHLNSMKIYAATNEGVVNAAVGFDEETLAPTYTLRMGVPGASAGINIAQRIGLQPEIIAAARGQLDHQTADIGRFIDQLHAQLAAANEEREALRKREVALEREKQRLEAEGRQEQRQKARELEQKLGSLMKEFEHQMREAAGAIADKAASKKLAAETERRLARLKREFSEQFNATVVAHITGADKKDPNAQPHVVKAINVGDTVKLRTLGREVRVDREVSSNVFEVSMGPMKMRVQRDDIAEVVRKAPVETPLQAARKKGGVNIAMQSDPDLMPREINVIGRTADEAQDEVERFLDQAFLAGMPNIRIVHGTGMGILRRTLREYLRRHPHVANVSEPPYNEGGQGATIVDLKL